MPSLRLVFMGTPDFAVPALCALREAGHVILAVYSQPPKPAGRGQTLRKSSIQCTAEGLELPVRTPRTLRDAAEQEYLKSLKPDAIVVAAYGLILPQAVLDIPRLGCLNIHGSLLPRWRGAAPLQRALLAGDDKTGITIMLMDAGLDTGPMLLQKSLPITMTTTATSLHDEMAELGADLIVQALEGMVSNKLRLKPQPEKGATYADKLTREDGRINWQQPAEAIDRQVRALTPWPGAFFMLEDQPIKALKTAIIDRSDEPGTLLDDQLTVACGAKAVRLIAVQRSGKSVVDGAAFLRGVRLPAGYIFP